MKRPPLLSDPGWHAIREIQAAEDERVFSALANLVLATKEMKMSDKPIVIAIIAADPNGVIGVNNSLPWKYKADMQRFKTLTKDAVVIMGRKTFDSIPITKSGDLLPGRTIIVVTRDTTRDHTNFGSRPEVSSRPDLICYSVEEAVGHAPRCGGEPGNAWLIGGAEVYLHAVKAGLVDEIDFTIVPEVTDLPEGADVVKLPTDFLSEYNIVSEEVNSEDPRLIHRRYRKCSSQPSK